VAELRLRLLGGLSIEAVAGRSIRLVSMKAQALLAYLAVSSEKTHRREHLAALLWGDVTEAQARDSLRHVVLALRKALVTAKVTGFGAEAQAVWLDKRALTSDIAALERALQSRDPRGRARAATLYRGDLLAGFTSGAGAGEIARQLLALDPARESAHRGLMKALAAEGRVTDALAQYRACVAIVKRELGIQPSAETGTLYDEIARAGTATDRASRADVATMPFVGRRDELTRLQSAMREGLRGRGRFALVLGEAGMGKSRVLEAVLAEARREGALALVGRCREGGAASPLAPWSEVARADRCTARARGGGGAGAGGADFSGARRAREAAVRVDGPGVLFEAMRRWLGDIAEKQPLLVAIEDLHWGDDTSIRLLASLARRLGDECLMVIATARSEAPIDAPTLDRALAGVERQGRPLRLRLGPLSREETARLVQEHTRRGARESAALIEQVWGLGAGHPFVTVEALHDVAEGGTLGERGGDAARGLVGRRLDRLGARATRIVAAAAVVARPFTVKFLRALMPVEADAVDRGVEELVRRHVFVAIGDEVDFARDRIREVAASRIRPAAARALHRSIAEAIERAHEGELSAHRAWLAAHHRDAGQLDAAVAHFREAGLQARARAAHREAARCFEEAIAALARRPESRQRHDRGARRRARCSARST